MQQSQGPRRARLIVLVAQLVSTIAFVVPLRRSYGFPLDDAWIHQGVARTFAETGTLGFRPGAFGAGATSYLWAALLGAGQALHLDPVVFTDLLAIAAALGAGQLLLLLAQRDREAEIPNGELFAVAACATCGDLVWFSVSGMEATAMVAFGLGALALAHRACAWPSSGDRGAWLAGFAAALAALTRPDCIPLGAFVVAYVFLETRSVKRLLPFATPWAAACALYFGANKLLIGKAMPATLTGRRWLWIDSAAGAHGLLPDGLAFLDTWGWRLRSVSLGFSTNLPLWLVLGAAAFGLVSAARAKRKGLLLAAGWGAAHFALFFVILPVPGHGGRYQPFVPLLVVLFASLGVVDLAQIFVRLLRREAMGTRPTIDRVVFLVIVSPWVAVLVDGWAGWRSANAAAIAHIKNTEEAAGHEVAKLEPDAKVASFDIGAIGYFAGRPVLDLGGLTEPRVADAMRLGTIPAVLRSEAITHVVLPKGADSYPDLSNFAFRLDLQDNPAVVLQPVRSLSSDRVSWLRGVTYTQNATIRQALYATMFTTCGTKAPLAPAPASSFEVSGLARDAATRIEAALSEAARHGLCVRLASGKTPARVEGCFSVRVDAESPLEAWPDSANDHADEAKRDVARWTEPYRRVGDIAGASLAALHGLMPFVQRRIDPCFWTKIPAIERAPLPGEPAPRALPPIQTAWWGIPTALLVAVGGTFLARRRQRELGGDAR